MRPVSTSSLPSSSNSPTLSSEDALRLLEAPCQCLGVSEAHEAERHVRLHAFSSRDLGGFLEQLARTVEVALLDRLTHAAL